MYRHLLAMNLEGDHFMMYKWLQVKIKLNDQKTCVYGKENVIMST